jgi:aspartokinase-like uncharacterized kinase
MPTRTAVVKVGGSLYDLPDLATRLRRWLDRLTAPVLLVPGGGASADAVRDLDRRHGLGEEKAHWLALRALTLNAHFLASLLPAARVIEDPPDCGEAWRAGLTPVLDAHAFARADEGRPGCMPHAWAATSDSLAARVAVVCGAGRLVLLKSVTVPPAVGWAEAGRLGLVDALLADVLRQRPDLEAEAVNLRAWPG